MKKKHFTIYDDLLEEGDLDEKTRAMILEQIRLDAEEASKAKAATKRRRLKALDNLSLLDPDLSLVPEEISHRLPGEGVHAPRDGVKPSDSRDILFLATLLEKSRAFSAILQCAPVSGIGNWIYLAENCASEGFIVKQKLSAKGIGRIFRKSFYGFRRAISSPDPAGMSFKIATVELRPAGSRGDKAFWDFVARLHHPFSKLGDPLLEGLHTRKLLNFPPSLQTDLFLCPLDGPVKAIEGEVSSPAWTWEELLGRSWSVALCPMCLGDLATTGYAMN